MMQADTDSSPTLARRGIVVVCGATGRQGGAVARHLLSDGWRVRGLTRDPTSPKARAVADAGVEMVHADMGDRSALERAIAGAYGVYSVQNPVVSGAEREVAQGKAVADAAKGAAVQHVVYGAAGIGLLTGVPSWDSKVVVAGAPMPATASCPPRWDRPGSPPLDRLLAHGSASPDMAATPALDPLSASGWRGRSLVGCRDLRRCD